MESLHDVYAVHCKCEPVWILPSARSPAFRRPGPAKAGTPNRRFMESPLSAFSACIGTRNLPGKSAAGAAHSKTWREFEGLWPTRQRLGVRRPSAAFDASPYSEFVRVMESPLGLAAVHWDSEPA